MLREGLVMAARGVRHIAVQRRRQPRVTAVETKAKEENTYPDTEPLVAWVDEMDGMVEQAI